MQVYPALLIVRFSFSDLFMGATLGQRIFRDQICRL
jgi:hypothetical protein